jgi:phage terminase Nu1 subunit (DNA packaging protein)
LPEMWARGAGVTIDAAAELAGVDSAAVRRWIEAGAVRTERRGDVDAVRLDDLSRVMVAWPHRERLSDGELEDLLRGRRGPS